ncbi:SDR family NAD(P)-dependent oxidoreductase [Peristeroidobacter soli]|uniref:SDR family NAD(P)-dependent oxidoreductase n=1 Tax=Peristeroidobacter soli TaxID=2497877 RepID=UPI00101DE63F|nr:SDR family oxidoreductase [Peristeroidobacter soli]
MSEASYPSLRNRHVVVTGGADGIGAALVAAFARQGARVTFLDIDDDRARATLARVEERGGAGRYIHCDLTDVAALQSTLRDAMREWGPVTVLVNNAANDERRDWQVVTSEEWDRQIGVNLKQQFFAIQAVAPAMAEAGGGSIVNMGSIIWKLGSGGLPCYATAKAAIVGLTRSFARDLGSSNIRVNSVLPGAIMTRRQIELRLTPDAEQSILRGQCLKRMLVPADVAPIVLFLAADDAAACTNQNYVVDGGWS